MEQAAEAAWRRRAALRFCEGREIAGGAGGMSVDPSDVPQLLALLSDPRGISETAGLLEAEAGPGPGPGPGAADLAASPDPAPSPPAPVSAQTVTKALTGLAPSDARRPGAAAQPTPESAVAQTAASQALAAAAAKAWPAATPLAAAAAVDENKKVAATETRSGRQGVTMPAVDLPSQLGATGIKSGVDGSRRAEEDRRSSQRGTERPDQGDRGQRGDGRRDDVCPSDGRCNEGSRDEGRRPERDGQRGAGKPMRKEGLPTTGAQRFDPRLQQEQRQWRQHGQQSADGRASAEVQRASSRRQRIQWCPQRSLPGDVPLMAQDPRAPGPMAQDPRAPGPMAPRQGNTAPVQQVQPTQERPPKESGPQREEAAPTTRDSRQAGAPGAVMQPAAADSARSKRTVPSEPAAGGAKAAGASSGGAAKRQRTPIKWQPQQSLPGDTPLVPQDGAKGAAKGEGMGMAKTETKYEAKAEIKSEAKVEAKEPSRQASEMAEKGKPERRREAEPAPERRREAEPASVPNIRITISNAPPAAGSGGAGQASGGRRPPARSPPAGGVASAHGPYGTASPAAAAAAWQLPRMSPSTGVPAATSTPPLTSGAAMSLPPGFIPAAAPVPQLVTGPMGYQSIPSPAQQQQQHGSSLAARFRDADMAAVAPNQPPHLAAPADPRAMQLPLNAHIVVPLHALQQPAVMAAAAQPHVQQQQHVQGPYARPQQQHQQQQHQQQQHVQGPYARPQQQHQQQQHQQQPCGDPTATHDVSGTSEREASQGAAHGSRGYNGAYGNSYSYSGGEEDGGEYAYQQVKAYEGSPPRYSEQRVEFDYGDLQADRGRRRIEIDDGCSPSRGSGGGSGGGGDADADGSGGGGGGSGRVIELDGGGGGDREFEGGGSLSRLRLPQAKDLAGALQELRAAAGRAVPPHAGGRVLKRAVLRALLDEGLRRGRRAGQFEQAPIGFPQVGSLVREVRGWAGGGGKASASAAAGTCARPALCAGLHALTARSSCPATGFPPRAPRPPCPRPRHPDGQVRSPTAAGVRELRALTASQAVPGAGRRRPGAHAAAQGRPR